MSGPGDAGSEGRADAEGGHGLGWLLKQHGLGAVTVVPDAEPAVAPVASVPETPADEAGAARPVSGAAPVKQNWFAPVTDTSSEGSTDDGTEDDSTAPDGSAEAEMVGAQDQGSDSRDEAVPGAAEPGPAGLGQEGQRPAEAGEIARDQATPDRDEQSQTPEHQPEQSEAEDDQAEDSQAEDSQAEDSQAEDSHTSESAAQQSEADESAQPEHQAEEDQPQQNSDQLGDGKQDEAEQDEAEQEPAQRGDGDPKAPEPGHPRPEPDEHAPDDEHVTAAADEPATGTAGNEAAENKAAEDKTAENKTAENKTAGKETADNGTVQDAAGEPAPAGRPVPAPVSPTPFARQPGLYGDHAPRRLADPEQVLASYPWRLSPGTLREVIDEPDQLLAVRDRLTDKLEYAERDAVRARLLSLRAVVSRVLDDLDFALADARAALVHAEATGELRRTAIVRARLAHVLRFRGEFAEADRLFEEANSVELPRRLRAEMYELAGRSAFDQGRFLEAVNRFEQALDLRRGDDDAMVARIETALDTIARRAVDAGWGPYPREVGEILQRPVDGEARVPEGYVQARAFSDGLAWVSRDAEGGWFAVDERDRVIVAGGFDDVGPFRHGVAPVRRGGAWGAVDRHGRLVVQPKYRRFVTALVEGRQVDGFTEEGLAVIDAGDRLGVIDRGGQLLVAPVHAALVIHPVAFVVADRAGRWGALDRNGDPLVEVRHRSEADVNDEIDRLLADTRPVL